ncbi:MAG TPA: GNAT family N-acetyltransferase, partial [Nitrospiria bacterium]|nr:GNAT family N-acetyltransferase [Nitrospiria bacterium]
TRLYQKEGVEFTLCHFDEAGEIEKQIGELFDLCESRNRKKGVKSTFTGPVMQKFHTDFAKSVGGKGWVRLGFLRKEGRAIAANYGFDFERSFFGYQQGFDPEWEKHSVGSILLLEFIKYSYEKEFLEFDFLRGSEEYKNKWTDSGRKLVTANYYHHTFRGGFLKTSASARKILKKMIKG